MDLKQLTSPSLINVGIECKSKEEVIRTFTKQLFEAVKIFSEEEFLQAVLGREKLSATGIEGGLAIPHGKSKAVKKLLLRSQQ